MLVGVGPSPLLAEGPGCGPPPLLAGVRLVRWWPFPRGLVGGFPCCVCLCRGACWCVRCVFVAVVWVWVCLLCVLARVWQRVAVCFPGWGLLPVLVWVGLWLVCGRSLANPGGGSCVLFPATPGWVALPVVMGVPRHSRLRAPGAVYCHSWLGGQLALVVGRPSPLLAEGPWRGSPPILAGFRLVRRWPFPRGLVRGFPCCVCLWRGVCWCVCCVFVAVVWMWLCLPCVLARLWRRLAVCFPGWGLLPVSVWVGLWLVCGRSLATPGGGSCVRFPATPGPLALPVVVGVPRHSWLRALGAVPCHSWLGSAGGGGVWLLAPLGCGPGCGSPPLLAGVRRPRRWPFARGWVGVSRGVCVCGVVRARVVSVLVCVSCLWWRGCGCVFRVCWCVCVCVWVCGWGRSVLAAGVGVDVVGVCPAWSLATPGGGS